MRKSILCLLLAVVSLSKASHAQLSCNDAPQEFGPMKQICRNFDHPVPLPPSVVAELVKTQAAGYARDVLKENPQYDLSQLFLAEKMKLAGPDEDDYVVLGEFPLTGADCDWFWVVRSLKSGPQVVLFSIGTMLRLLPQEDHGLPEIRADWWPGNGDGWARIFRFDGKEYKAARSFETCWVMRGEGDNEHWEEVKLHRNQSCLQYSN